MKCKGFINKENEIVVIKVPIMKDESEEKKLVKECILTNRRVIYFNNLKKDNKYKDIPLEHITSIEYDYSSRKISKIIMGLISLIVAAVFFLLLFDMMYYDPLVWFAYFAFIIALVSIGIYLIYKGLIVKGTINLFTYESRPTLSIEIEQKGFYPAMERFIQLVYFVRDKYQPEIKVNVQNDLTDVSYAVKNAVESLQNTQNIQNTQYTQNIQNTQKAHVQNIQKPIIESSSETKNESQLKVASSKESFIDQAPSEIKSNLNIISKFKKEKSKEIEDIFSQDYKAPQIKPEDSEWFKDFSDKDDDNDEIIEETDKNKKDTNLFNVMNDDTLIEQIECEICGNKMPKSVKFCNKCGSPMK